jgi:hypothetical protein
MANMTLAVPISSHVEQRLADKAKAAGVDLPTFLSRVLEAEAQRPTVIELSGEAFDHFKQMNLSDEELGERLEQEKHAARAARRGSSFAE